MGNSGNKEKNKNIISVLKEVTAQFRSQYFAGDNKVLNAPLEMICCSGLERKAGQAKAAKQPAGRYVGCVIYRCLSVLRRDSGWSLLVISQGPRASSFHPVMWELFFH